MTHLLDHGHEGWLLVAHAPHRSAAVGRRGVGGAVGGAGRRTHLSTLTLYVTGETIQLLWICTGDLYHPAGHLLVLARLLEHCLDRLDLGGHLALLVGHGAHLHGGQGYKYNRVHVPPTHLHVDHLRGLRADGPDHLVAGLVSLDADPVPGGLRLAALGSVYLDTVPATDQLPATHRGEGLGAELRHVLETVHRTLGLGGEAGAGQGEAEQGHQLHGGGWRVEGELSGSAESQISTTTTSTATAPPHHRSGDR